MKVSMLASLIMVGAATILFNRADAATYTVGDGLNWVNPPIEMTYSIWASRYVFVRGDVLEFKFNNGIHNVAEVTKQAYEACNTSSPIIVHTNSPVRISLPKTGKRYFISTLNNDCRTGLKLAINVLARLPPSPSPRPSPDIAPTPVLGPNVSATTSPTGLTTPPSRNSATSTLGSSLFSVFVLLLLGLLSNMIMY